MTADILKAVSSNWTPGGYGIWVLVFIALGAWWKGLPTVLDAWSNSVSKERDHREREIARLERQIIAGDLRHEECVQGQAMLRGEITRLNQTISGMVVQMRQIQMSSSALQSPVDGLPPVLAVMVDALNKMPGAGE